jgi:hypothetical protein
MVSGHCCKHFSRARNELKTFHFFL